MGGQINWLWHASGTAVPQHGIARLWSRGRQMAKMMSARAALEELRSSEPESLLARTVAERPQVITFFEAPYLNARWTPQQRIHRFAEHVRALEKVSQLSFSVLESLEILSLDFIRPGYHLVIDKPSWFHREGTAAINIFDGNTRIFTLAFSLERRGEDFVALIGGIQGRNIPGILDRYRDFTKLTHGLRPRDFIIDVFRMVCSIVGVQEVLAVSDACRHHRSRYFGIDTTRELPLDYDVIWLDRGGQPAEDGFFSLPLHRQQRDDDDIPAKKRSMYKKRYELLAKIETLMTSAWATAKPVRRPEAD